MEKCNNQYKQQTHDTFSIIKEFDVVPYSRITCVSIAQDRNEAVESGIGHDPPKLLNL